MALVPAVDDYSAESTALGELTGSLAEVRQSVGQLRKLEKSQLARRGELAELKAHALPESKLHLFRGRVVELARSCGCQVRRVGVGQSRQQAWRPGDDPLQTKTGGAATPVEGGMVLASNELTIAITGPLAGTQQFLERLEALGMLVHPRQLILSAAEGQEKEVNLDLGLLLFDIDRKPQPRA